MLKQRILTASIAMMLVAGVYVFLAQAARQGAGDAAAHIEQGTASFSKNQFDEAVRHFSEAVRIDPNNVKAYNNRGVAYSKMGRYDQAIADFNKALRIDPQFAQAYNNRSMAYFRAKDYAKACADLRQFRQYGGAPSPEYAKELQGAAGKGQC